MPKKQPWSDVYVSAGSGNRNKNGVRQKCMDVKVVYLQAVVTKAETVSDRSV